MNVGLLLGKLITITSPILNGRAFEIKTAPVEACYTAILSWLLSGVAAGFVLGPPRCGKTCAVRWSLKAILPALGLRVHYYEIPARSHDEVRARDFFSYLLKMVKHRDYATGTAGDRRDRLQNHLILKARASPLRTVILYFDEAQFLTFQEWKWLLNISNEAVVSGIRIFYVFSGTEELAQAREHYIERGQHQLVGRYMAGVFRLSGLASPAELQECLSAFSKEVYPKSSKKPLIEHFVDPARYPNFSLESYAPHMWDRLLECAAALEPSANPAQTTLPMHYVTAAMLRFLTSLATNVDGKYGIDILLAEAINHCGFDDFIRSTPEEPKEREAERDGRRARNP
ncbi:hypothetical protein J2W39_004999 [Variovorax paradoxus]|jgi:hypothetical protein|uniref:ORC1/DEAH AAA+ ATPase domain-containing protein n=1 Tax=Variovorax paradoxus TaxID=34073 RepID=A0AAW8ELN4_VARPD|nr:ATP-binding protein [Variovorax paradoxus]MDP9973736.1 hypothetical protein [Variovorax paradoxus]